jgi:hypothetical protein
MRRFIKHIKPFNRGFILIGVLAMAFFLNLDGIITGFRKKFIFGDYITDLTVNTSSSENNGLVPTYFNDGTPKMELRPPTGQYQPQIKFKPLLGQGVEEGTVEGYDVFKFEKHSIGGTNAPRIRALFQVPYSYFSGKRIRVVFAWFVKAAPSGSPQTVGWTVEAWLLKQGTDKIDLSVNSGNRFSTYAYPRDANENLFDVTQDTIYNAFALVTSGGGSPGLIGSTQVAPGDIIVADIFRNSNSPDDNYLNTAYILSDSMMLRF